MQRWQRDPLRSDQRPIRVQTPKHTLSPLARERLLSIANSAEFGHLSPSQMVPTLADRGQYHASESTFYRVLSTENQLKHRHAERPPQRRGKPRALTANAPDQLFSWDITYLPTRVKGLYFYLYLFIRDFPLAHNPNGNH